MADVGGDKYRSYLTPEELKTTKWRAGPPNYDAVNKLFEEGRTNVWAEGSLEEQVQKFVKTWEMEMVHKSDPNEYKTLDPEKFVISMNGKKLFNLKQVADFGGSYNIFLHTSLPPSLRFYDPDQETYESSQSAFKTVFPRGFALEILKVYSGPPVISYKFRHWGYMEGPFKGSEPTGELVEFFGTAVFELDENSKVVKIEFFCDRGELLAPLIKGNKSETEALSASAWVRMDKKLYKLQKIWY
ncbi:pathogen-related protein [Dorcoceras hygrometricum]|uniref:Pathogen-related protein n=1 Tax=Dorcoceras hygrometricum TaxID=472368 RepID=A0A2Z7AUS3_9LAMI|nr:pathogen-related protein [Dorcoceras hygrometricum]